MPGRRKRNVKAKVRRDANRVNAAQRQLGRDLNNRRRRRRGQKPPQTTTNQMFPSGADLVRHYGPRIARAAGSYVTRGIGALITGFGAYKIKSNSLMFDASSPPTVQNSPNEGGVIIRHREFIGNVTAATNFTLTTYILNPGLPTLFPWLSAIASSFDTYEVRGAIAYFRSTSSDAVLSTNATSSLGKVLMAFNHDVLDADFPNDFYMENYQGACVSKPSCDFICPIECARNLNVLQKLYVRKLAVPTNSDARMYDFGKLNVAVVGSQSTVGNLGELWFSYEIRLCNAKIPDVLGNTILTDHWYPLLITGPNPFGASIIKASNSTLNGNVASTVLYNFPAIAQNLSFFVFYAINGTAAALTVPTFTFGGCTALNIFRGNTTNTYDNSASTSGSMIHVHAVTVNTASATLTLGTNGVYPTAQPTNGDFLVMQVPTGLNLDFLGKILPNVDDCSSDSDTDDLYDIRDPEIRKLFALLRGLNVTLRPPLQNE